MNKTTIATLAIAVSFSLGLGVQRFILNESNTTSTVNGAKKPLYWVAPMDPNYKRDNPGKSPMGMDLVPVYEELGSHEDNPGTITISPEVVNNLGVRTAPASIQSLAPTIRTVGLLNYNEDSLIQINSRVEGWVENLKVGSVGEFVNKGEKLFDLYSPALVNAQEELLSALRSGNKALIQASKERLGALDISKPVIDRILRNRRIERTLPFYADRDGYVSQLSIREGGYVNPSKTLIELANLDTVWVVADVFERQSLLVKAGQKASMTVDYLPGQTWEGDVDYVYPTLDPETRSLRVRLRFDNPGAALKPNMYSKVAIYPGAFDALSIPREALIRTGKDERVVKALGDGKFRSAKVESGREIDDHVEILRGLAAGDKVVTSAQFLLDSESSINADLSRFEKPKKNTVWADGVLQYNKNTVLTITHEPVTDWGWPDMTMDFVVAAGVDTTMIKPGQAIRFEIEKRADGSFQVISLKTIKAKDHKGMNHPTHNMPDTTTDHQQMNHKNHDMGNTKINHETMDHSAHGMPDEINPHQEMDHSGHDMGSMPMDHSTHAMPDESNPHQEVDHSGHDMGSMPVDHNTMDHSAHDMPDKGTSHRAMDHSAPETNHDKMGH